MANNLNKLNSIKVLAAKSPGVLSDGGGLCLRISPVGNKNWTFRYMRKGRAREMGLGSVDAVSLADARKKAAAARTILADGKDPLIERTVAEAAQEASEARTITFETYARDYVKRKQGGWKNAKHQAQWLSTLKTYAFHKIGAIAVADVDTGMVLDILNPIWVTKTTTAQRVRGRIETLLDAAKVQGKRTTPENPARWRGHLEVLLPNPRKVHNVTHFPSLEYNALGLFYDRLRTQPGEAARGLCFLILTATRTTEVRLATWGEFDLEKSIWTIPKNRMKANKEHRVPLSQEAMALLREVLAERKRDGIELTTDDYIFVSYKPTAPLSNNAFLALLERMDFGHITAHGFRASFRTWAAEQTNYPRAVVEAALAHTTDDKTEEAYQRSDFFERRRVLMAEWGRYCLTPRTVPKSENVFAIRKKTKAA